MFSNFSVDQSVDLPFLVEEMLKECEKDNIGESGCVQSLISILQSCKYKTLWKHVREVLSCEKVIPSNIVLMMNSIIAWEPLNREQNDIVAIQSHQIGRFL